MADKPKKEKQSKEEKQKEKAEKKALKKAAKEARKKAKLEKKQGNKESQKDSDTKDKAPEKRHFLSLKKIVIILSITLLILGSAFVAYKLFFSSTDEPVVYKSISFKNVNLPDEMLKFTFDHINDLYFAIATYDLRISLLSKEIDRINKVEENYPDQSKIAQKEKKDWVKAKEKIEKQFNKIENKIKELYVLHQVNKEDGLKKIEENKEAILSKALEELKLLDPFMEKIKGEKKKAPGGLINNTIYKIKKLI